MSGLDTLSAIVRHWQLTPAISTIGSSRTGLSVALWEFRGGDVREFSGEAYRDTHIVSVPVFGRHNSSYFGDGRMRYAKVVDPWSLNIVRAGEQPRAILDLTAGGVKYIHVYLPNLLLADLLSGLDGLGPVVPELRDPGAAPDHEVAVIAREILAEVRSHDPLSRLRIDTLGQDLAILLLRRHSNLADRMGRAGHMIKGGLAPWQVRRVSDYLEDHLADDVTLAELGELLGLSTFHLCRAFKQSTGLPPHRWRHQRRLERGRELLDGTTLPITEIAAVVGYDDPSRFAAGFRKVFGLSPTEYRRERRS